MPISIDDQVIDFYQSLFDQIFTEPFRPEIPDRRKRNDVKRRIEETADAASQSLIRFFINEQLTETQVADILDGFAELPRLLGLEAISNSSVTPESGVEGLLDKLPCPKTVRDKRQDAVYRVALHTVVQGLMLIGPVMAEWQSIEFVSTFELLSRVVEQLNAITEQLNAQGGPGQAAAQGPIQDKLIQGYKRESSKRVPSKPSRRELEVESIGGDTLPITAAQVTRKTLPALAAQPQVVAILPNQRIHLIRPKEVKYEELEKQENKDGLTWGLKHLEIPEVWKKIKSKGKGIKVAVLDTGVHGEHAALAGKVKDFIVIDPLGRRIKAKPTFDCDSHGTHVCGTIAGGKTPEKVSIGVAPEASLYVAAVILSGATLRAVIEGIAWAIEKGVDIISMSLGFDYYEPLFSEVFEILINQYGILPVVAIGNENHGNTSSPGNVYNAFSVGAVEKMPGGKSGVPFFSSGASLVFPGVEHGARVDKPDVVAPGVQVYSCVPPEKTPDGTFEYSYMDGTSMATPHVAGVAALLMAAKPQARVSEIINVLKDTAKHPNGTGGRPDNRYGFGVVQPLEALKALD